MYDEADDLEERMRKGNGAISDLMRYFGRPVFAEFSALTYLQYYEQYSVEQDQRHPSNRRRISINNDNSDQEEDQSASLLITETCIRTSSIKKTSQTSAAFNTCRPR